MWHHVRSCHNVALYSCSDEVDEGFHAALGSAVAGPPARLASPREFLAFSWQECEISVHYAVEEYVATPSRPGERERRLGARERERLITNTSLILRVKHPSFSPPKPPRTTGGPNGRGVSDTPHAPERKRRREDCSRSSPKQRERERERERAARRGRASGARSPVAPGVWKAPHGPRTTRTLLSEASVCRS